MMRIIAFFATFEKPHEEVSTRDIDRSVLVCVCVHRTLRHDVNRDPQAAIIEHSADFVLKEFDRVPITAVSDE